MANFLAYAIGILIGTPFVVTIIFLFTIYNGWALLKIWTWFLLPVTGIALTLPQCIGIMLLFALKQGYTHRDEEERRGFLLYELFQPIGLVTIGYIVQRFM